jgi:nitrous oxidase accessory protein
MDGGIGINKFIILLLVFLILTVSSSIGTAAETFVQPGESIQAAVNNASSGDIISVKPGTYNENIKVNIHNLVIKSESNPATTIIISKNPALDVFTVKSENVTISGFKIEGAGLNLSGIYMDQSKGCTVENNRFLNNSNGIYLKNSENNMILNNLVGKSNHGIILEQSNYNTVSGNRASKNRYGIYLPNSNKNLVTNNTLSENKDYGILLSTAVSNTLSENEAFNNGRGIHFGNSDGNTILNNRIYSNEVYGLFICPKSDKNLVFNNYFNNTVNAIPNNGTDNSYNMKKTAGTNIVGGPYLAGNFWADPIGTGFSEIAIDSDVDGIADEKFKIEINSSYIDRLPLVDVEHIEPILPAANFSENLTGGPAPLSVLFTDLSENETERTWDFESDGTIDSLEESPVHTYTTPGIYTVNLTASNENGTASKNIIISVTEEYEETKLNGIVGMPGFEVIYGVVGLLAVFLYNRS